jgi:hypothetical protein
MPKRVLANSAVMRETFCYEIDFGGQSQQF